MCDSRMNYDLDDACFALSHRVINEERKMFSNFANNKKQKNKKIKQTIIN